ncbi:MAG: TetR/AcrR family transcriptional regulator [Spirochaetota bacterium]
MNKQYDRTDLLEKAIVVFRRNGYHATSTSDLAHELGINKKSMYSEFQSKLNIFQCALEHYNKTFLQQLLEPIEEEGAKVTEIKTVFHTIAIYGEKELWGLGCLFCNTASERGSLDPCIGPLVDGYFERIHSGFFHSLTNHYKNKKRNSTVNLENLAAFLTTALIGMATSIRAKASAEHIWGSYHSIVAYLENLP